MEHLTKADREELGGYLASKLLKRGLVDQPETYLSNLLTGYLNDWLDALEGEGLNAPDPGDGPREMYDADDFRDQVRG